MFALQKACLMSTQLLLFVLEIVITNKTKTLMDKIINQFPLKRPN